MPIDHTEELHEISEYYKSRDSSEAFAERYNEFGWSSHFYSYSYRTALLMALRHCGGDNLTSQHILDLGCGRIGILRSLIDIGASPERLTGVDLMPARLQHAQSGLPPSVNLITASGHRLPLKANSFELVHMSMVLSSVLSSSLRVQIAEEAKRVTRPGGHIIVFDYFISRGSRVRPVSLNELRDLFGDISFKKRMFLAFSIGSRIAEKSLILAELLSMVPLFCTHNLLVFEKK